MLGKDEESVNQGNYNKNALFPHRVRAAGRTTDKWAYCRTTDKWSFRFLSHIHLEATNDAMARKLKQESQGGTRA